MKLQDELREKVAVLLVEAGYTCTASALRGYGAEPHAHVLAAAEAVIAVLDGLEEREVWVIGPSGLRPGDIFPCDIWDRGPKGAGEPTRIYIRKQEPKKVEVTREDAGLLARFVEGTPRHSDAVDAAADRVRKAIGGTP